MGSLMPKRTCRTCGAVEHGRQNAHEEIMRNALPGYVPHGL